MTRDVRRTPVCDVPKGEVTVGDDAGDLTHAVHDDDASDVAATHDPGRLRDGSSTASR
jgi:hypothetical protein